MREFKIFAFIADIHIGKRRLDPKRLKYQLKEYHIKPLKNMKHLDGIFILGDVLDTIISMNSDNSELFHWLVSKWYSIAKKRNCPCIIIRGTKSHDNDQLNTIKHYENNDEDVFFRVYDKFDTIRLYDKYDILLLPDIKIKDNKEVEKFFNRKYDMILGHGLISTMQFFVQESENMPSKTYVYDLQKLIDISRGPIIFGHIHQYTNYKNKFYYVGSFDKIEKGSLGRNGFLICGIYDNDTSKYKIEQYINEEHSSYYNIELDDEYLLNTVIDKIIRDISYVLEDTLDEDLITVSLSKVDSIPDKIEMIVSYLQKDSRISIKKKLKNKIEEKEEIDMKENYERLSYIMDENLTVSEIMFKYYNDTKNEDDVVLKLEDFTKILGEDI